MDYKTLFMVLVSVFLIQAVTLMQTWLQNREEIGTRDWAVAAILMAVGSFFSAMAFNMQLSAVTALDLNAITLMREAGNAVAAGGWFMVWIGVRHFYGKKTISYRRVWLFTLLLGLLMMQELFFELPGGWRVFWVSLAIAFFAAAALQEFMTQHLVQNATKWLVTGMLAITSFIWFLRALVSIDFIALGGSEEMIKVLTLYDGIVASVSLTVSMILLTNERIHEHLNELALKDPLTGALNRRAFFKYSHPVLSDMGRSNEQLALCLLDLDHFKQVNDTYGHAVGDRALERFAEITRQAIREGDIFARHGGEEFVILMRRCSETQARQIVERLQTLWSEESILAADEAIKVTFSAGVSHISGPVKTEMDTLLEAADNALYRAKDNGRNQAVFVPVNATL